METIKTGISILGLGSWGTSLATVARHNAKTFLWGRDKKLLLDIQSCGENRRYLPGISLKDVEVTDSLEEACKSDVLVVAIPSKSMRSFLDELKPYIRKNHSIVCCTKGFEMLGDRFTVMSDLMKQALGEDLTYACLSGPTHAEEVSKEKITLATLGCEDEEKANFLRRFFVTHYFRVYTNQDLLGVEVGGAYKNIIAIAGGVLEGLDAGENAIAALITRALPEMSRFCEHLGGESKTLLGLSGIGDLITTVFSKYSRNRFVGKEIAKGRSLDEILSSMSQVAEGVRTTKLVYEYCQIHDIMVPIAQSVYGILFEGKNVQSSIEDLMRRSLKAE